MGNDRKRRNALLISSRRLKFSLRLSKDRSSLIGKRERRDSSKSGRFLANAWWMNEWTKDWNVTLGRGLWEG